VALLLPHLNSTTNPADGRTVSFLCRVRSGNSRQAKWELRGELGVDPITGKRKQFSETFHGQARAADQRFRGLIDQRAPSRSDGVGVTFGQLLDQWLEECERLDLSPTTLRPCRSTDRAADPSVPGVGDSDPPDGQEARRVVLGGQMGMGSLERRRHDESATGLSERVEAPSLQVVREVIEAAERRDPRLARLLMLAALTGMRRGELCDLRWSDLPCNHGSRRQLFHMCVT